MPDAKIHQRAAIRRQTGLEALAIAIALVDAVDVDEEGDAGGDELGRGEVDGEGLRLRGDRYAGLDNAVAVGGIVFWEGLVRLGELDSAGEVFEGGHGSWWEDGCLLSAVCPVCGVVRAWSRCLPSRTDSSEGELAQ